MVLAVVLNQHEASEMARSGVRVTAIVKDKYTRKEQIKRRQEQIHSCFIVEFQTEDGKTGDAVSCDRGIDQIFDRTKTGDQIRIVYKTEDLTPEGNRVKLADFMLEDWADEKLTSFKGPS